MAEAQMNLKFETTGPATVFTAERKRWRRKLRRSREMKREREDVEVVSRSVASLSRAGCFWTLKVGRRSFFISQEPRTLIRFSTTPLLLKEVAAPRDTYSYTVGKTARRDAIASSFLDVSRFQPMAKNNINIFVFSKELHYFMGILYKIVMIYEL